MRVINIVDTLDPNSGVFNVSYTYAKELKKNKVKVDYIYFFDTERSKKKELLENNINVLKIQLNIREFKKNKENIISFLTGSDQIVLHNHVPLFSNFIMPMLTNKKGISKIVHAHSSQLSNTKIKSIRNKVLLYKSYKYYDAIWGCSENSINTWYGKKIKKLNKDIKIIPNPINCKKMDIVKTEYKEKFFLKSKKEIVLGTVGRLVPEKNHVFLLKLLKYLKSNYKTHQFKLIIVGEGPEFANLKKTTQKLKLENQVLFPGFMSKEKMYEQMLDFNFFLLPSFKEGLGVTLIESQYLNVPSIASYGIPIEADLGTLSYKPLVVKKWAKEIMEFKKEKKVSIQNKSFCKEEATLELISLYENIISKE